MKILLSACAVFALISSAALAAPKTYQVTGPVLSMDDKAIVVQKGSEKWEISKGSAAIPADVKVGSKVTVFYTMTATDVEDKSATKTEKTKK